MNAPHTTSARHLEEAISEVRSLAADFERTADAALNAAPDSQARADQCNQALGYLEDLEVVVRAARTGIEALP